MNSSARLPAPRLVSAPAFRRAMFPGSRIALRHLSVRRIAAWSLLGAAMLLAAGCTRQEPKPPQPKPLVKVVPVVRKEVAPEVTLVGTVVAFQTSRVASGAAGLVQW